ncbi:MAG: hypothetical protein V9E89_04315 [Ilumatobacteraceae bacterium]
MIVGGDADDIGIHRPRPRGDAAVRPGAGQDEAAGAVVAPAGPEAPGEACRDQGAEVAGGAAADEHAAGLRGQAGQVGEVAQRLVLGEHGTAPFQPRSGVDARRPDDQIEQHGGLRRGRGHERQEPRVIDRDARRRQDVGEHAQGLEPADAPRVDRVTGHRPQLGHGARPVQRGIHAHPVDGVAQDRLGEDFGRRIVQMHPRLGWLVHDGRVTR